MSDNIVKTLYSEERNNCEEPVSISVQCKLFTGPDFQDYHYLITSIVEDRRTEELLIDEQKLVRWRGTSDAQVIRQSIAIFDRLVEEYTDPLPFNPNGEEQ